MIGKPLKHALRSGRNAVRTMPEWAHFDMLNTKLAAPISHFETPAHYPRKMVRSMGPVSLFAVRASEMALADAGLLDDASIKDGRMGIAYGSSSGSVDPVKVFGRMLETRFHAGRDLDQLHSDDAAHGLPSMWHCSSASRVVSSRHPAPAPRVVKGSAMPTRRFDSDVSK